jgi:hypothetical protein
MGQPTPKALTGARAIIRVNGEILAFATSVTYTFDTQYVQIWEVDSSSAAELAPTKMNIEVTCTNIKIPDQSPTKSGIQANFWSHLKQCYSSIEILDRNTDELILFVETAMLTRREGTINSRGIATETWVFKGMDGWDEQEPYDPPMR